MFADKNSTNVFRKTSKKKTVSSILHKEYSLFITPLQQTLLFAKVPFRQPLAENRVFNSPVFLRYSPVIFFFFLRKKTKQNIHQCCQRQREKAIRSERRKVNVSTFIV